MIKKLMATVALLLITATYLSPISAETGYISDVLYVPLRSGKGNQFRIIDSAIKSGTRLEILERDDEWVKARIPNGKEGFIRAQYIIGEPTAKLQLQAAESELANLSQQLQSVKKQFEQSQTENNQLKSSLSDTETQLTSTSGELDEIKRLSADALDLNERHQQLLNAHQLLQHEIDVLKAENSRYKNDNRQKWFFYGAGAVLLGVIIALIVPVFTPTKRKTEWLN